MPIIRPGVTVMVNRQRIADPIVIASSVITNASGVARLYLTQDGTASGDPIFRNLYGWVTDVEATTPATTRTMSSGINYIEATVSTLSFTGVTILGIGVLGSVANTPVSGVSVKFIVIGD